jgi:hypothetical protein
MEPDVEQDVGEMLRRCDELLAQSQRLNTEHQGVLTELERLTQLIDLTIDRGRGV